MNPLISIIIPTYNRAYLIAETLESIIAQNHKNWECLIVDDGSTDDTATLIANYIKKDNRFQYHQRPVDRKKGANACRNYGFELSKGEYVKWFDSDDIMHPDFLEKQVEVLENNNELNFCASQSLTFHKDSEIRTKNGANRNPKHSLILSYLVKNHYFFTGAPLWRKEYFHQKDLFDENLSDSHESDFHFRMLLYFPKYIYTNDFLFSIRRGNESITQNIENKKSSLDSKIIFFSKARKLINEQHVEDKDLINKYLTFRISNAIYELCIFNSRLEILKKNKRKIVDLIFQKKIETVSRINLCIGFVLLLFLGKGYSFLKGDLNIREEIIN
ncbi:glycosyltransferase family 2 protein [Flavobacterium sp. M31R6]|uniref:glycosyltransferase family 2 protein n=1 Tax=Flavobacterium sp. M31R6 TaxID=2739062 RepID=UPI00156959DB|nr:glycosyltransferase family 2 protein [Flavobacterium sp. M31R6]QKJ64801.1 glycosyltransferase family 2 protein [Flavobacterium sp. M31R6]